MLLNLLNCTTICLRAYSITFDWRQCCYTWVNQLRFKEQRICYISVHYNYDKYNIKLLHSLVATDQHHCFQAGSHRCYWLSELVYYWFILAARSVILVDVTTNFLHRNNYQFVTEVGTFAPLKMRLSHSA